MDEITVKIIDGPHKGEEITLNYWVPSIRLIHHTWDIDEGCVDIEYAVKTRVSPEGAIIGYIGTRCQPSPEGFI